MKRIATAFVIFAAFAAAPIFNAARPQPAPPASYRTWSAYGGGPEQTPLLAP